MEELAGDIHDELALARRAASGDHAAFGSIVRSYEARLLAYLTQMLGDPEAARDIAQETFLAAFQALPRWRPPEQIANAAHPLSPWLYRIATNRALSMLRAVKNGSDIRRPGGDLSVGDRSAGPTAGGFEERYAARELLRQALRRLSEEDAACLVLHFVAGERYGEIAARLGLTGEAVRKRVSRGLTTLREAYAELDTEVRA